MDSRLKRITLVSVILVVVLIGVTVVFANFWPEWKAAQSAVAGQETSEAEGTNGAGEGGNAGSPDAGGPLEGADLSAFMRDDTFFDRETSEYLAERRKEESHLSLAATSVEKDIRIQVLNGLGELAAGQDLYVMLDGETEYKDLDRDGIIYIGDLKPGEYQVSLREMDGFKVPSSPLPVRVKEKVEYLPIDDISLLIKTEDEIDALAEDTGQAGAEDDAEDSQNTDMQPAEENRRFGIDVSKWNKEIDWEQVKAAGVDFAIIRCGYRGSSTGVLVEDPYFYRNVEAAGKAGVELGLYFFTQAVSEVEAVEEASMVLALNGGRFLEYPVFIDTEGAGGGGRADALDRSTRTSVCRAFCETIENAGYRAGVYASRNWLNDRIDADSLDDWVIWLAEYREEPSYQGKYEMWQYTSRGSLEGIEGNVDFNVSYIKTEKETGE